MGAPPLILKLISGLRIPFVHKPRLMRDWENSRFVTPTSAQMSEQIALLKRDRILEVPEEKGPSFISKMFLIPKNNGDLRQIFDLRGVNKYITTKYFRLISQARVPEFLQPGDWMVRVDLSQAYFHVPIAPSHRCFLRLVYDKELLQMTSFPFGLSSAPHTFATITNWVAETLRLRGMRVVVYLDDFLLTSQSRTQLTSDFVEATNLMQSLGWKINFKKCVSVPCQELEFLGLIWNTRRGIIQLPTVKLARITQLSQKLLEKRSVSLKEIQCLLGHLNFANFIVHRGRLHCRHLQRFCARFKQRRPRERIQVNSEVIQELKWWCAIISPSAPLHKRKATHFLTTDAADEGWGAQLIGVHMSGSWTAQQLRWHSNKKELFAVHMALRSQSHNLKEARVLLQTDNRTVVAYIQKEGGTKSLELYELTYQLLKLIDDLKMEISAFYLPGKYNNIADSLSRKKNLPEWHLLPVALKGIFKRWGVSEIDLFASAETAVVKTYASRDCKDRNALFIDAFSQPWNFGLAWIFPPPNLMPRVLSHLNVCQGNFLVVAPRWEKTFWMSDLVSRTLEPPITIKDLRNVLVDVTSSQPPPQVDQLCLQVWKVGGGAKEPEIGHRKSEIYPQIPQAQDLARFIAHLFLKEGLAYNTILVYKSAIVTFCAGGPSEGIGADFLVKQMLKAIAVSRPKEIKSPTWDAEILLNWLLAKTDNLSFYEVSRRTASLLLLASGRRISDMTLLKISKDFLINLGNEIIMWPSYGSKTDRPNFRQSGWKLSRHQNIWICPITWLRVLLKKSEERRLGSNIEELFITVTGTVKAATKTIIAGWIKSALKDAGIEASPGSVRAAVASKSWIEDVPIQQILDRGNWRCAETFRKFYCRETEQDISKII
ncbi:uncharacterized protein [Prorops nasuta]|uniref:uncharacterized protein n=1 Tax=Prorops nasuta TaxID=863751 RepID=UPI0034CF2315